MIRARRDRGRIENGVPIALFVLVLAFGGASAAGHGFTTWPLWGKILSVVAAIIVFGIGASSDESKEWKKDLGNLGPPHAPEKKDEPKAPPN